MLIMELRAGLWGWCIVVTKQILLIFLRYAQTFIGLKTFFFFSTFWQMQATQWIGLSIIII